MPRMNGPRPKWRDRREALGMSIRELSRRSGVNRGTISRIERGWAASPEEAEALVRVLGDAERGKEQES